ncbi:MAG: PilZ domain-containing protein [Candidatus Omnitrophota bacterium]
MKLKLPERRRFIRVKVPLKLVVKSGSWSDIVITKNISPVGLNFEVRKALKKAASLKMELYLPLQDTPVYLEGKMVWQRKKNLEDQAPYITGVEILKIEEKSKNLFLRYVCDLLYNSAFETRI